jgi:hypothetical protein
MNTEPSELTEADIETWNQLWASLHQTHYQAYFDELYAESAVGSWRSLDSVSRLLQLLTASGSAIAGWALWKQEGFKEVWMILAGAAAVIALFHTVLNVSENVKEETLVYCEFSKLRLELERLKSKMQIKAYETLSEYKKEYFAVLERFGTASALKKPESILFRNRPERIQTELNKKLGYE